MFSRKVGGSLDRRISISPPLTEHTYPHLAPPSQSTRTPPLTATISICCPNSCSIYVVCLGPLWSTFYHYKSKSKYSSFNFAISSGTGQLTISLQACSYICECDGKWTLSCPIATALCLFNPYGINDIYSLKKNLYVTSCKNQFLTQTVFNSQVKTQIFWKWYNFSGWCKNYLIA